MRSFHPSIAACAVAGSLALSPAFAMPPDAGASAAQASHEAGDEADAILAARPWNDLLDHLRAESLTPVDEPRLRAACRLGLTLARPAGWTASDVCFYAAMRTLGRQARYVSTAARAAQSASEPVGIGLELAGKKPGEALRVVAPFHGGTGERAGIRPGDRIEHIDGRDIVPLTMIEAIDVFRGSEGSIVALDIVRGPADERLSISARREKFAVPSLRPEALSPAFAALRFSGFRADTPAELARWADAALRATTPSPAALLVDLRGNTGGILEIMTQVAGAFASDGTVVAWLKGPRGEQPLTPKPLTGFSPAVREWLAHVRIAVLVDARTGSGAEALALFLREQRGARIFGAPTSGHAEVRQHIPMDGLGIVEFQDGELRSSKHVAWEGVGVVPDDEASAAPPRDDALPDDSAFATARRFLEHQP